MGKKDKKNKDKKGKKNSKKGFNREQHTYFINVDLVLSQSTTLAQ